jgi:hypothetical protein
VDGKLYYFTPGGFLYGREPETEEVGGFLLWLLLPTRSDTTGPTTGKQ